MPTVRAERILAWVLRIFGGLMLLALVPMFMPTDWMSDVNDWLGLERFNQAPLTEYLTRSLSALYAFSGALFVYVSRDVRHYRDFIGFAAILMIFGGLFMTGLDLWAGMPASWTWTEGPPMVVLAAWIVWLTRRVP